MSNFDPTRSIFYGMPTEQLQAALVDAQQAYIALSSGSKGESFSYTQGDGARSVTYTRTNLEQLRGLIQELQMMLNPTLRTRRPMRPYF